MQTPHSLLDRLRTPTDRIAWNRFVDLFVPLVDRWVRRWGADDTDADDVVQDIFARLLHVMPGFAHEPGRSFHAWLWTVSRNQYRQFHRQRPFTALEGVAEPIAPEEPAPLEEREFRAGVMARAMRVMQRDFDTTTWKAFEQAVMYDRSAADIARELGISANAVYLEAISEPG